MRCFLIEGEATVFHVDASRTYKRNNPYFSSDRLNDQFNIGDRIFHQKFGYGRIKMINGEKLEIAFEKAGKKNESLSRLYEPIWCYESYLCYLACHNPGTI